MEIIRPDDLQYIYTDRWRIFWSLESILEPRNSISYTGFRIPAWGEIL